MTAADVTDAPWAAVVDDDMVYIVVSDDDLQPTVCSLPTYDYNGLLTPLAERVVVAERIVADHLAARQRRRPPHHHVDGEVVSPW